MARGRPKKEVFETPDDQMAYIFAKLYDPVVGIDGEIRYVRTDKTLTLEEMALVRWYQDGCPERGPITKVGEEKKEAKILQSIKMKLLKAGWTVEELYDFMALLAGTDRRPARCCDRVEAIEY